MSRSQSPDMFASSPQEESQLTSLNDKITWRGSPLFSFKRLLPSSTHLPPLAVTSRHEVYIKLPLSGGSFLQPSPTTYIDIWDGNHVRMPNSPDSLYPVNGKGKVVKRWNIIKNAFENKINSIQDLHKSILSYNSRYEDKWTFYGLKRLIEEEFVQEERDYFFKNLLPKIINLALDLPNIVTRPLILLKRGCSRSITLSKKQIASLLANAFLCTFPRRNARGTQTEYASYPDINFSRLFSHGDQRALEKIKCIIHYFKEIVNRDFDGVVTFSRQSIDESDMPEFQSSSFPITRLHIDTEGLIESADGFLQMDFANKYVGGGVLGLGCVQEEIRFVLCPELLVSRLFTEVLNKNEALIFTGVEQFSEYKGYSSSFEWKGPHKDNTPVDSFGRRLCQIVALDAVHFSSDPSFQYKPSQVMRELQKAYVGFKPLEGSEGDPIAVATGNWGCGAFKGDPRLKGLIQIAAASIVRRDLAYFTFGDKKLREDLANIHLFLREQNVTVGQLVMALGHFGRRKNPKKEDLLEYIYGNFSDFDSDSDSCAANRLEDEEEKRGSRALKERMHGDTTSTGGVTGPKSTERTRFGNFENQNSVKRITDYFKPAGSDSHRPKNIPKSFPDERSSRNSRIDEGKLIEALNECDKLVKENRLTDNDCGGRIEDVAMRDSGDLEGRHSKGMKREEEDEDVCMKEDRSSKTSENQPVKSRVEYSVVNIDSGDSSDQGTGSSFFEMLDVMEKSEAQNN